MKRRPPRVNVTDTLSPYITPFRSPGRRSGRATRLASRMRVVTVPSDPRLALSDDISLPRSRALGGRRWRIASVDSDGAMPLTSVTRSEEHTSELQSLMRISYAVFCLKKKTKYQI